MGRALWGPLSGITQGGDFGPGRVPHTTVRLPTTVPPANTAHPANTGPRVPGGLADRKVPSNPTDLGHKVLKSGVGNHPNRAGLAAERKAPAGPNKTHAAHTPAGRANK